MSLITILLVILVVGVVVWAVQTYAPIPVAFKHLFSIVAIAAVVWWILVGTGILNAADMQVGCGRR